MSTHDSVRGRSTSLDRAGPSWLVAVLIYPGFGLLTWYWAVLPWWLLVPYRRRPDRLARLPAARGGAWPAGALALAQRSACPAAAQPVAAVPALSREPPGPSRFRDPDRAVARSGILLCRPRHLGQASRGAGPYAAQALQHAARPADRRPVPGHRPVLVGRGPGRSRRGDRASLRIWLWHVPAVALVLLWVAGVCGIPLWQYLLLTVLPGTSLTLVRSFAEHKAAGTPLERTALVESGPFMVAPVPQQQPALCPPRAARSALACAAGLLPRPSRPAAARERRTALPGLSGDPEALPARPVETPAHRSSESAAAARRDQVRSSDRRGRRNLAHWLGWLPAVLHADRLRPGPGGARWRPLQRLERAETARGRLVGADRALGLRPSSPSIGPGSYRSGSAAAGRRRPDPRAAPRRGRGHRVPPGRPGRRRRGLRARSPAPQGSRRPPGIAAQPSTASSAKALKRPVEVGLGAVGMRPPACVTYHGSHSAADRKPGVSNRSDAFARRQGGLGAPPEVLPSVNSPPGPRRDRPCLASWEMPR